MRKFSLVALIVAAVLGMGSLAFAGNSYCHNGVGQLQAVQSYGYNNAAIQLEIVNPANNFYRVVPQPVIEVQKVERVVVPQDVKYYAQPQRVQQVERIQVQNYNQPVTLRLNQGYSYSQNQQLNIVANSYANQQNLSLARNGHHNSRNVQRNVQRGQGRVGRAIRELRTPNTVQRNVQRQRNVNHSSQNLRQNNIRGY